MRVGGRIGRINLREKMKKSELQENDICHFRCGDNPMIWNSLTQEAYSEELKCKSNANYDIIKVERPTGFETVWEEKLPFNAWYSPKTEVFDCNIIVFFTSENSAYGQSGIGEWIDHDGLASLNDGFTWKPCPPEEVKQMLTEQMEKHGIREGVRLEASGINANREDACMNSITGFVFSDDLTSIRNKGLGKIIFKNGIWATPLKQNSEVQNLIDKLKELTGADSVTINIEKK